MKPPKRIVQLEVIPRGISQGLISVDYKDMIQDYERQNGRANIKAFHPYSLVDFYSERFNGEPRFIIISDDEMYWPSEEYTEDLKEIEDRTYIYVVKDGTVKEERKLTDLPTFIQI
ncbi:hypothetical protein [Paenibacillus sp. DYY-L-2]|uniref:hypothetical protein n=1 Tax=Paenibacillus sp. DYY-L-2 TaxID=3447013 RepID=UPI003F506EA3